MNTRLSLALCLVAAAWAQRGGPPLPPSAQRAQQLFRAGNYAEAEAAFRTAVADAPGSAAVQRRRNRFRPDGQVARGPEVFPESRRSGRNPCREIGRAARHGD